MGVKRKVWIDTDCGGDDAVGIMAALTNTDVEVCGISVVWGNVNVNQALENVGKLLDLFQQDVPIYKGAAGSLIGECETVQWGGFGSDGFGDAPFPSSARVLAASKKHASIAIVEWINSLDVTSECVYQIITLGPLTNLALALRLQPDLCNKLGSRGVPPLVVMGGTIEGKGNSSLTAEFNIHCDPEAARIVFLQKGLAHPFWLVSWELTVNCAMSWHWYDSWIGRQKLSDGSMTGMNQNRMQIFLEQLFGRLEVFTRPTNDGRKADTGEAESTQDVTCVIPDAVAMVAALCPDFLQDSLDTFCTIELHGQYTRGMTCIDWYGTDQSLSKKGRWRNCKVVTKGDLEVFLRAMKKITAYFDQEAGSTI